MVRLRVGRRELLAICGGLLASLALAALPGKAVAAEATVQLSAPFSAVGAGSNETSLGDLVADAVRNAASAQVALVDAEALHPVSLAKGPAKIGQFQGILTVPDDSIVALTVRGEVIAAALERGVSNLPQSSPGFLQVSGMAYTLNPKAGPGSRIDNIMVQGKPLDRAASYTVAMPLSLAQGANGYFTVWPAKAPSRSVQKLAEALATYLADHDTLSPSQPRIIL